MSSHVLPSPLSLPATVVAKFRILMDLCGEVAKGLGKGRTEAVYQDALCIELQAKSIPHTKEETIPILYKGVGVGHERLDIGLRDWLDAILELKAVSKGIDAAQLWQVHSYMEYKRCDYGVVINFSQSMGDAGVEVAFVAKADGASYVYQVETGLAIPMKGNLYETPILDGKMVSDAAEQAKPGKLKKGAVGPAVGPPVLSPAAAVASTSADPFDDWSSSSTNPFDAWSSSYASPPPLSVKGIVAAAAAVTAAEEHRIANERKRLQGLWIEHKVKADQPVSKLLGTLRKGLKEAGVPF